jgi:hypothetical protein
MVEFPWLGLSYQLPITDMLWQMLVALPASPAGDSRQRAGLCKVQHYVAELRSCR